MSSFRFRRRATRGDKTPVNTYTREMWHDIDDAILEARFNDDVSVILITGHGEKFFSQVLA